MWSDTDENPSPIGCDSLTSGEEEQSDEPKPLPFTGRSVLTREQQSTLFEILKCAVCLEIPKGKPNLQVKTCEKGHHFCMSCHKKLKSCAICRGRLFLGRNFAVEELISKLGGILGVNKCMLPAPKEALAVPPGKFPCPHNCNNELFAVGMLPHIRSEHKDFLQDNVRSNPYTQRFDWMLSLVYHKDGVVAYSIQVSDIGLLTIKAHFTNGNMRAWVQTLCHDHTSDLLRYKITLRHTNSDFSLNDAPVLGYFAPVETPAFNVSAVFMPVLETEMQLYVSIWRADVVKSDPDFHSKPIVPEDPLIIPSDRNFRRNRSRNLRRRRLKHRLGSNRTSEQKQQNDLSLCYPQ